MRIRKVSMAPSYSVYSTFKYRDYKIYKAIAEYIDNSTQSFFDHEKQLGSCKIEIDFDETSIRIRDNAWGMNDLDLESALHLGDKPKSSSGRHQFGMGLKVASIWFTDNWEIRTKKFGEKYEYRVNIKMSNLLKGIDPEITNSKAVPESHFTEIRLMNLSNRKITGKSKKSLMQLLATVYKNDLSSGKVEILVNGDSLKPIQYEYHNSDEFGVLYKEFTINFNFEGKKYSATGNVGIRTKGSTSDTDGGFSLVENGRVIIPNWRPRELVGASNSYGYQRLVGEINLVGFQVTSDKQNFDWDNGLKEEFIENLKVETEPYNIIAGKIRTREPEEFNDDEKEVVISAAAKPIKIEEIDYDEPKLKVAIKPKEDISYIKKIAIGKRSYNADINIISSREFPFVKYEVSKLKIKIFFNRNHEFLKPKINNKEELVNYSNLLSVLVVSLVHSAVVSGAEIEGKQFVDSKVFVQIFNETLKGVRND